MADTSGDVDIGSELLRSILSLSWFKVISPEALVPPSLRPGQAPGFLQGTPPATPRSLHFRRFEVTRMEPWARGRAGMPQAVCVDVVRFIALFCGPGLYAGIEHPDFTDP